MHEIKCISERLFLNLNSKLTHIFIFNWNLFMNELTSLKENKWIDKSVGIIFTI